MHKNRSKQDDSQPSFTYYYLPAIFVISPFKAVACNYQARQHSNNYNSQICLYSAKIGFPFAVVLVAYPAPARCCEKQPCSRPDKRILERQNSRSFRCIGLVVRDPRQWTFWLVTKTGQQNWLLSTSNVVVIGVGLSLLMRLARRSCELPSPFPPMPTRRIPVNLAPAKASFPEWKRRCAGVCRLSNIAYQSPKPKRDVAANCATRPPVLVSSVIIMPTGAVAVRYFGCKSFKFPRR